MTKIYRIAERNIQVSSLYDEVHSLCANYISDAECTDFSVTATRDDIESEREKSAREDAYENIPVRRFSDAYLETLAIYRKIAERMPYYDTILFHGSCVAVDGIGYLFTAKSGTGKSTHTALWRKLLSERAVMVNDDKPLIRIAENGAVIYGTPWNGKHRLSNNISVPLKAVCVIERASENVIRKASAREVYPMLLQQSFRPSDASAMNKTLTLIDRLASSVSLWRLECNTQIEAARVAYEAMKG